MTTIRTPEPGFTGEGVGGLVFTDGVAETDSAAIIAYAREAGYGIDDDPPIDSGSMSQNVHAQDAESTDEAARAAALHPHREGSRTPDAADPDRTSATVQHSGPYPDEFVDDVDTP